MISNLRDAGKNSSQLHVDSRATISSISLSVRSSSSPPLGHEFTRGAQSLRMIKTQLWKLRNTGWNLVKENFPQGAVTGKPPSLIRDFVIPSRPCFKPSSSRTVFTISQTVDQIKVKPCNSFAELRPSLATLPCRPAILSFYIYIYKAWDGARFSNRVKNLIRRERSINWSNRSLKKIPRMKKFV